MKRIEEAKKLLLGPDHESDQHLTQLFKKTNQIQNENEELNNDGPSAPEKVMKIEITSANQDENKKVPIMNFDEIQALIEDSVDDKNISEENLNILCSSILENHLKLNQFIKLVTRYETETISKIVVPMLELDPEQDFDSLKVLSPTSQKILLESLNNNLTPTANLKNPNWKILVHLTQLDYEDPTVQSLLASILVKQGHHKDLMLGKYLLSVLKNLPQIIESYVYELFNQAVNLNGSFVKKACETEMKRFNIQ